jgi:uncharacterized protein
MTSGAIIFLTCTVFCTSMLTAVVGAGGGTALLAIMLQIMSPAAAIPVHGAVQLSSNTTRVWLLWKYMAWPVVFRFAALMPFGVWLGLELFQGLPTKIIQILIGCVILISLVARRIGKWQNRDVPLWAFMPIGFVTGALNMVVGVIAPILGGPGHSQGPIQGSNRRHTRLLRLLGPSAKDRGIHPDRLQLHRVRPPLYFP